MQALFQSYAPMRRASISVLLAAKTVKLVDFRKMRVKVYVILVLQVGQVTILKDGTYVMFVFLVRMPRRALQVVSTVREESLRRVSNNCNASAATLVTSLLK